jgi:hypothetical protein
MRNTQNPEVFLDISIGGNLAERIEIEVNYRSDIFSVYTPLWPCIYVVMPFSASCRSGP